LSYRTFYLTHYPIVHLEPSRPKSRDALSSWATGPLFYK